MEKMLITKALDDREFLKKKSTEKIHQAHFVATIREKDKKIGFVEVEDFEKVAKEDFQSIVYMIDRYNRIDSAITLSNATLKIKFSNGVEITKAEAIAKKKAIYNNASFNKLLATKIARELEESVITNDRLSREADRLYETYNNNLITSAGNNKLDEDQVAAVEAMVAPNKPRIIDPIGAEEKFDKLTEEIDVFISEVDTLLKVSNATEFVEF